MEEWADAEWADGEWTNEEWADADELKNKVTCLTGDISHIKNILAQKPERPFAEKTISFLDAVSEKLRGNESVRNGMSDVMAYAFWCRRANLERLRQKSLHPDEIRIGKKVSLHFAASNMPVLFAFSLTAGLLAGNSCIVRMPQKETPQETVIVQTIHKVITERFPEWKERIFLCRYGHEERISQIFSMLCDVRVIWGSDCTVQTIKSVPLRPGAIDLPFAARYSAAVFSAGDVLHTKELDLLVKDFYNDTYLNDQNACSAPRILYWKGKKEERNRAQERFWKEMHRCLEQVRYQVPPATAVRKLDAAYRVAALYPGSRIVSSYPGIEGSYTRIVRVNVKGLRSDMWEKTVPGGFFIEYGEESIDGISPVLTRSCQTLCTYQIEKEELLGHILKHRLDGVDRIVPVGHALDFSLVWDGYDMIRMMSRRIGEC